jgi:probable DNA metabolism protein
MLTCGYDGSFEGMLCAFAHALPRPGGEVLFENAGAGSAGWLFETTAIETDPETAWRLSERIRTAGGEVTLNQAAMAFLADTGALESHLYEFIRLTLARNRCLTAWHANDAVRAVSRIVRDVGGEIHRFQGLLRFVKLRDGVLYAAFEPDHNVIMPVARHFTRRLRKETWVIHDRRRETALAWNGRKLLTAAGIPAKLDTLPDKDEKTYQEMWRLFTNRVAITERENPVLQRRFMPRRYWRYLPEMAS